MKRRLVALKAYVSRNDRDKSETRPDWQSPALDNARVACQLLANLGSGVLVGVPGLQAAGQVAIQIIDIIKKTRGNKADCEDLVLRIVQLLDPLRKALENQNATDIDLRLKEDLERFIQDLEKIRDILQLQVDRSITGRVVNSVGDGEDILRCKELVDQGFKKFEVYTAIALRMDAIYLRQGLYQLQRHNTCPNDMPSSQNVVSNALPPSQPIPPEIFFGRDEIVSDFSSRIVHNQQTRIAILGAGGIGKTATALHILHHKDVVARYEEHRYFVGCDAVNSAETLATLILQIIQAPSVVGENIVTLLHQALLSSPPTLLLLDNFETVWYVPAGRDHVIDLLQKIGNAKNVSLMITMRAAVPPAGIAWTCFSCLPPLLLPDAKSLFLAVNPSVHEDSESQEYLDTLLAEMDYVPLAVQLLAQVGIGFSPQYLLKRWRDEKTAMLHTQSKPGKLESIGVSVSLSLATLDITSNPEAVQLLGILCQLPDGLHQWEKRLSVIAAGLQNIHHLVHLLYKTAIISIIGSGLKVLSPIRHFINCHHQADFCHIQSLENYFWNLVHTYATTPIGPSFPHAKKMMEVDMGNIHSLVKNAVQTHPSGCLVEIVLEVSEFQYWTVPSTDLLYDIKRSVKKFGSPIQEAQVLKSLGKMLHKQGKHTEASEVLTEAQGKFLDIGYALGAAQCTQTLGNILRMQTRYTKASEVLGEAQKQFLNIGDALGAAQCSRSLGDILRRQAKYTEAFDVLTEAQSQFLNIGGVLGTAVCSQGLGDILRMQGKYAEASKSLIEAQQQFLDIGSALGVAQCSKSLGEILHMQAKYPEASQALTEAQRQLLDIGDAFGAAQCSEILDDISHIQV